MRKAQQSQLLIFNFAMDKENSLLSHQYDVVSELSKEFDELVVITGKVGKIDLLPNIKVISTNWIDGKTLSNLIKLFGRSIPTIFCMNFKAVFFHMTDLQCALFSPILKLRAMNQYLWYAHTKNSVYLIFSALFVDKIITSTPGSCTLRSSKVLPIGQGVDADKFQPIDISLLDMNKLIHIGRFDKSKRIDLIVDSVKTLKNSFVDIELTITGSPSSKASESWANSLREFYSEDVSLGWLNFVSSIPRNLIPTTMERHGCFIHAYEGSLDKTIIEATMLKVPVVTVNPEYCKVFGTWSKAINFDLVAEYQALRRLSRADLDAELSRRLAIAQNSHSLENWTRKLASILSQT